MRNAENQLRVAGLARFRFVLVLVLDLVLEKIFKSILQAWNGRVQGRGRRKHANLSLHINLRIILDSMQFEGTASKFRIRGF
jgi:hypothetical protein